MNLEEKAISARPVKKVGPGKNCKFAKGQGCTVTNPNGSGCLKKQKQGKCFAVA